MKNLHDVDWGQMHKDIKDEVAKIGYHYIADRPLTTHPDDWYLRVVLGYNESYSEGYDKKKSYATWIYNADLGGLHHGHYNIEKMYANKDFLGRS